MLDYRQTEKELTAANLSSIYSFESENGDVSTDLKCVQEAIPGIQQDQKKCRRQKRTNFSLLQRHELERAFNQCQYLTPHSCRRLQELGIHKQNLKVWFKNRRVKWRKEMRNWGLPEKGKTACVPNSSPQANILPLKRSHLQPENDRHNEGITMQGLPLVSENSTLSHSSNHCVGLWNYSWENSSQATNFFYSENKGFPPETAGSTRVESFINSTSVMDSVSVMGSGHDGVIRDGGDTRSSLISFGGGMFESGVIREPHAMHEQIAKRQHQPSYFICLPCTETNPGQRSGMQQVCESDQKGDVGEGCNRLNEATMQGTENGWLLDDLMNIIAKEQLIAQSNLQQNGC